VQTEVIQGLSDASPHVFRTEGLRNLVRSIAGVVRRHGAQVTLINATGGYKAQISFAGMIGQTLEIPVCYLFEGFSDVITLPPQPIALDLRFWLNNAYPFTVAGSQFTVFSMNLCNF
jgi:CRISPR/Cas system-associated protein Csm6